MLRWIFVLLMLFAQNSGARADGPLVLAPTQARVDLTQVTDVLEDPGASLDFAGASSPAATARYEKRSTSLGYTTSAWWLRFQVSNPTDTPQTWWLDTGNRTINELDFYSPDASGVYQHTSASSDRVFADRPLPFADFVFPFRLEARQTATVYLRVRSTLFLPTTLKPSMWTSKAYTLFAQRESAQWLLYMGMVLALSFVNIALWFYLHDRIYVVYVAALIGYASLVSCAQGGFGSIYENFWPNAPLLNQFAWGISLIFAPAAGWLFNIRLLSLDQFSPKRIQWILRFLALVFVLVVFRLTVMFDHDPELIKWSHKASTAALVLLGLTLLIGTPIFLQAYRARVPLVGYSVISLVPLAIGAPIVSFASALGYQGVAPIWLLISIWEMLVMALALADRFFQERRAKLVAQEEIIATLKRSEAELEQKVAQRTLELEKEQGRTKELLHNMLPVSIAEELAATGTTQPVRHEAATVLFTDFSGFTQAAATMPPNRMVAELNEVFAAFDKITDECGVEKIKTIGDAYMAAAGVTTACHDHAQRCVRAGLAMVRYLETRNGNAAFKWQLRVGIHTGPVVAGVVGTKKFAFDIWGDTVNTASRMESSGEVGRVNVSAYTYDLIRNDFDCEYRGKVSAKGKGEVDMYFVKQHKA